MSASSWNGRGMVEVLLGLGGNLGDPAATITAALRRLDTGGVTIKARSPWYRTAPWGRTDQPDFVNLCAAGETSLAPRELLDLIKLIEANLGRERRVRWGPRTIDIDILAYGDETIDEAGLRIPHPHIAGRAFVLLPLRDIAPDKMIDGQSVREMAARVDPSGVRRMAFDPGDRP